MKYGMLKLTSVAAAVSLACGIASAQDDAGLDREGVAVEPRIEATDEPGRDGRTDIGLPDAGRNESQVGQREGRIGEEGARDTFDLGQDRPEAGDEELGASADVPAADSGASSGDPAKLDELAQEHQDLGTFIEAVKAAGLADALTGDTAYTVFAPTDDALESMPEDWMEPENREQLLGMLRAHIVADDVDQETAKALGAAQTIDGGSVQLSAEDDELTVGGANVVEPDIRAGNLTIHAIDDVLSGDVAVATAEPGLERDSGSVSDDADADDSDPLASDEANTTLR